MLHKTKGIILRTVKYGETSMVVTMYTELFGIQSYLINGVRSSSKKGASNANLFQPVAMLDLVVYHNELKNLQRIRDFKWGYLYQHIFSDVRKNAVALFMIELLAKCLKQPEANADLFNFIEDSFIHLDKSSGEVMANFSLFFALNLAVFFGVPPSLPDIITEDAAHLYFDLKEGSFTHKQPKHPYFLEGRPAFITAELLRVRQPEELKEIKLNHSSRRILLHAYESYYALHIQEFGSLKTLPILKEVLG